MRGDTHVLTVRIEAIRGDHRLEISSEVVDFRSRSGLFGDVDTVADRHVGRITATPKARWIGTVKMADMTEQFPVERITFHTMLARIGSVYDPLRIHAEADNSIWNQQSIQGIIAADVVAEVAGRIQAPDRAPGSVSRQHIASGKSDGGNAYQGLGVAPNGGPAARAVEDLDLAD